MSKVYGGGREISDSTASPLQESRLHQPRSGESAATQRPTRVRPFELTDSAGLELLSATAINEMFVMIAMGML